MKEFKPKTRKQMYKAIAANDIEYVPRTEHIEIKASGTIPAQDFIESEVARGWYESSIIQSEIVSGDHVYANGNEIFTFDKNGDYESYSICFRLARDTIPSFYLICNFMPTEDIDYSVKSIITEFDMSKLMPKTNGEKYLAAQVELISSSDLPEPKTVDEYYIALECGWEPTVQENDNDVSGNITNPK